MLRVVAGGRDEEPLAFVPGDVRDLSAEERQAVLESLDCGVRGMYDRRRRDLGRWIAWHLVAVFYLCALVWMFGYRQGQRDAGEAQRAAASVGVR